MACSIRGVRGRASPRTRPPQHQTSPLEGRGGCSRFLWYSSGPVAGVLGYGCKESSGLGQAHARLAP
eukprot:6749531-Pyramimonas_sp.AAC.1